MKRITVVLIALVFFVSGCATTLRKSPTFETRSTSISTIAVLPADIKVYKLTAGGVRELVDEWCELSQQLVKEALNKYLGERYGFQLKFISEEWLKKTNKELWLSQGALYNAVAISALLHAYPGINAFSTKMKSFDYTLGADISALAELCEADTLLFISGVDHEATAGRTALLFWNILMGAVTGVTVIPLNPSFMSVGLVDADTGELVWFNISPPESEYSFRQRGHIDSLIEWLTRDFLTKK